MTLTVAELLALPVTSDPSRRLLELLVDYRKLNVAAIKLQRRGLLARSELVPFSQVKSIDAAGIAFSQGTAPAVDYSVERFGSLLGKEVYTERRRLLGKVQTFKLDGVTGMVTVLWVKTPMVLRGLWKQTIVVARQQVVEVTPQAVIVDELVVRSAMKPATTAQFAQQDADSLGDAETASPAALEG